MSEKRPRPRSLDYDDGVYPDENRGSGIRDGGVHYASRSDIVTPGAGSQNASVVRTVAD